MRNIIDIHTHKAAPLPEGIISIRLSFHDSNPAELYDTQAYSVGIHPWDTGHDTIEDSWESLEQLASGPNVIAIGECGIDLLCGIEIFRQLQIFKKQVELSEKLHKPVIVHAVKSYDIICGLRRDLKPAQPWVIHGFRGKPAAAQALLRSGCLISFGEKFNPDTLASMPLNRILAETDESDLSIDRIITRLSQVRGVDLTDTIKANSEKFCNFEG